MSKEKYTAGEALNEIRLRMMYDSSKTLNENISTIKEQIADNFQYFETVAKSIMNKPDQIAKINFGNPTIDVSKACTTIKNAVTGLGTTKEAISYVTENAFKDIQNSMGIIKTYPQISGGESLYQALNNEWFAGDVTNKLTTKVAKQVMEWCRSHSTISICIPKTPEELKYGKY
jgi:hypothetical protein